MRSKIVSKTSGVRGEQFADYSDNPPKISDR